MGAMAMALANSSCVTDIFHRPAGYDQRPLAVQTVSLFNQRQPSRLSKRSWKGDWILRRDRLEMIDAELKDAKPDILVVQEAMSKRGSTSENDGNILRAGSLLDYDWHEAQVEIYDDTQELQGMVVAVGVTLGFVPVPEAEREVWVMGAGGYLMAATVAYEDQPVTVFNVQLPQQAESDYLWYSFIQERIAERVRKFNLCAKRVVIAGLMPGDEGSRRYTDFIRALQLKDVASGFCQIDSRCYTSTPTNDIFMATVGDENPTRTDRIFVHQTALVYSSGRNFDDSDPNNRYVREFGLTRLWPTQRFGWAASVRLARCEEKELGVL